MKDNYGHEVPIDLVLIPTTDLFMADVEIIEKATWYEVIIGNNEATWLCVSAKEIDYLSEDDINNYDGTITEILQVNDVLKRWNEEDGFYHV